MGSVQPTPVVGSTAVIGLLLALSAGAGLGRVGWSAGLALAAAAEAVLAWGLTRGPRHSLSPADWVTRTRLTLVAGVAALVADGFVGPLRTSTLLGLTVTVVLLDGLDGRVARRTGTVSAFGARFDLEVDALLVLVLSIGAARTFGGWVLVIGLARYGLLLAAAILPWLRGPLPPRLWNKVVAVTQMLTLLVAGTGLLPVASATWLLVTALGLLAESFGREIWTRRRLATAATAGTAELVAAGVVRRG